MCKECEVIQIWVVEDENQKIIGAELDPVKAIMSAFSSVEYDGKEFRDNMLLFALQTKNQHYTFGRYTLRPLNVVHTRYKEFTP